MEIKTRRGYYLDLRESPHEYVCKNGVKLKFASKKKHDMYVSCITLAGKKIDKAFGVCKGVKNVIPKKVMKEAQAACEITIYKEGSEAWRTRQKPEA